MENLEGSNITSLHTMMSVVGLAVEPRAFIASASLAIVLFAIGEDYKLTITILDSLTLSKF